MELVRAWFQAKPVRVILPLTSLRFFAALMVVAHHYWGFQAGYAGVSFFYVLSGYVLTLNYRGEVDSWHQRLEFWWKRVARIYPLHLLTILMAVPLGVSHISGPLNLMLLHSWVPVRWVYFSLNVQSWSISNEAFFYACFPTLLAVLSVAPVKRVTAWAATFLLLAGSVALLAPQPLMVAPTHFLFYIFPLTRLIEFAAGMALALRPARRWKLGGEIAALGLMGAGVALAYAELPGSLSASVIFWPASVALVRVFSASQGPLGRLLSHPSLVLLGEASFALYMVHYPLLQYRFAPAWLTAVAAVGLSLLLHRYFEKPVQKWLLTRGRPAWSCPAS